MSDTEFLAWPFFDDAHRDFAVRLDRWCERELHWDHDGDVDQACVALARRLGDAGWLAHAVADDPKHLDLRTLCLARDILARHSGLADFVFAMQGLGTASIALHGSAAVRALLPAVRAGESLAAFALSEPDAGSDVAALATTATPAGDGWRLDGRKTWISNGGIAGHYVVFARTGEAGARGLCAFVVQAGAAGLVVEERIEASAPHPLATLRFDGCRVPDSHRLGTPGEGFKVAMATLDIFRPTVGAAALGFSRAALDLATRRALSRPIGGRMLADIDTIQAKLADMAVAIDASALLVYRAAWMRDVRGVRTTRESAMAKLHATEAAQRVVDEAVQICGGLGVRRGERVEALYREVRALRIYEGASEIQRLVIARQLLGPLRNQR